MLSKIKKIFNYIWGGLFLVGAVYFFGFYEPKSMEESSYNLWSTFGCDTIRNFLLDEDRLDTDLRDDLGYEYVDFVNMSEIIKFPNSSIEIGMVKGDQFTCSADMIGSDGSRFENTLIYFEVGESAPKDFLNYERHVGVDSTEATYVTPSE